MKEKEVKAYITCPVSYSQERLDLLQNIRAVVESRDIEAFVFMIGGTPDEIFKRDYKQMASSHIIIAEVSERSHGVGIEVGMSYCLGLKRILLLQNGESVSKLAQGMPDTTIIKYEALEDLKDKLAIELDNEKYHKL